MSRRGSRGRRAARRQAQDRRDRAFEDWLKFREQADQREVEALERELRRLAQRPGWSPCLSAWPSDVGTPQSEVARGAGITGPTAQAMPPTRTTAQPTGHSALPCSRLILSAIGVSRDQRPKQTTTHL
jgi:hypothetical protein